MILFIHTNLNKFCSEFATLIVGNYFNNNVPIMLMKRIYEEKNLKKKKKQDSKLFSGQREKGP